MDRSDDSNRFRPAEKLDEQLQREIDEALGDMSLEDFIETGETGGMEPQPGAEGISRGKVIAIHGNDIFVDFGGKTQGVLPAGQFQEEEPLPAINDIIEVVIDSQDEAEGLLILSRKGAVRAAAWETLEIGQTLEGRVTGSNKGGLELTINGIRAFMPISQIEIFRVEDLSPYKDQQLQCEVIEIDRSAENVIVSRRAILERESAARREELIETLVEGKIVRGKVRNIMPYGAFVDLGGIDGLLHVSDMSYSHVDDPKSIVKEGQEVEVMILKFDRDQNKISLGLKQAMADPWADAETKWPVQAVVTGRISRLVDFGAFVELEEGVEGLVPIGEMTFERRIRHPSEVVTEGQIIDVRVLNVDTGRKRIGLSIKQVGDNPWIGASVRWPAESVVEGKVTRITDFGAFVELAGGVEGLVHISELSNTRVRSAADVLKEGQMIKAKVLAVDEDARRIGLSIKQLASAAEPAQTAEPQAPAPAQRKRKKPLKGGFE